MASEETKSEDVLIVGAGVIGLACAWEAARRGFAVRVLERDRVAAGASGVAAGMLAPVGEAAWGEEALLALNIASLRRWDGFAAELESESGAEIDYRRGGALHVALDRDEAEILTRRHELQVRLGLDSRRLRPSECRRLEPGLATAVAAGVHAPGEAAVDPQRLCAALAVAVQRRGGRIELGAEVVEASFGHDGVTLGCADGSSFEAGQAVIAAGARSGAADWISRPERPPVRPVKGELLILAGSPERPVCEAIVASERVYVVPRRDGRLVVGATVEEHGFDTRVTAGGVHELLREGYRLLPEIAELELVEARAGLRPGSPDNAPLIGRYGGDGPILATGHYRNGVLQAPITAEAVAAHLLGESPAPEAEPFAPTRFAERGGDGVRAEVATR